MRIALLVSLALNLLLIGAAVGIGLGEWRRGGERIARAPNMRAVMESLPPERAEQVRGQVIGAWRAARDQRREARAARLELVRIASADAYDKAAVQAAFARLRTADAAVAERFHDVVAEAMAGMSGEERRQMLRRLAARRLEAGRGPRPAPLRGETEPDATP